MKRTILGVEIDAELKDCMMAVAEIETEKKRVKVTLSDVVRWFIKDGVERYQLGGKHEK